jgi:hypothetical protein
MTTGRDWKGRLARGVGGRGGRDDINNLTTERTNRRQKTNIRTNFGTNTRNFQRNQQRMLSSSPSSPLHLSPHLLLLIFSEAEAEAEKVTLWSCVLWSQAVVSKSKTMVDSLD